MTIGYIGLGKMGLNMVTRLKEKGHDVVAYNRSSEPRERARAIGAKVAESLPDLVRELTAPRIIWIMVPNNAVDDVVNELTQVLEAGDLIIDGGNSFFEDSVRRHQELAAKGLKFMDVGVSGGPGGARSGACLMVGGDRVEFERLESVLKDLSVDHGYKYLGTGGAGHFVKMVHNGIEYGMMQALGEGFEVLKKSNFDLKLKEVADIYNHGSVIESRLVGWLKSALESYSDELNDVSGTIKHTGEGEWTVKTAEKLAVTVPVIKASFNFRVQSAKNPSFTGKVVSALRNQFGGHSIKNE